MIVRVGTLNVENLFARYKFRDKLDPIYDDGFMVNDVAFEFHEDDSKKITAKLIREMDADILALQEVENLHVLDRFNSKYLQRMGYKHRILIDSFDLRKIDVALLSRYPIVHVRSFRQERNRNGRGWVFSRDCLEVDVLVDGSVLRLYVNHFKSMIGGRRRTKPKRETQVKKVVKIIDNDWAGVNYQGDFIVLGDFNDYPGKGTALDGLLKHKALKNVLERLPEENRWTHYWSGGNKYSQLDYILVSNTLAQRSKAKPEIFRQGLPLRASEYSGKRIKGVGENYPKASDHAGIVMDLVLSSSGDLLQAGEMVLSKKGRDLLKEFEGYRSNAYLDQASVATIGYGTTKYEDGSAVKLGDKITKKKADELFKKDLLWAQGAVNKLVNIDLKQNQFDALVSFVYNIGEAQFKASTLLRKLNNHLAGVEKEFSRWIYAGNKISQGLKNRRNREKELFLS